MPRYRFTSFSETVLHGLAHGVNAELHRADDEGEPVEHEQPPGSTVVVQPGDEVETDQPYPHAHLVNLDTGEPDEPSDTAELADGLAAVEAAGQGSSEALSTLRAAAAGADLTTEPAPGGQHAAETSDPPAAESGSEADLTADTDTAASSATDEGQE